MSAPRPEGEHVVAARAPRGAPPGAPTNAPLALALAWAVVGIPAVWGVAQTVIKSLALFR